MRHFIRHVHLGIKSLMLHKLRSLLTMLGVVFGVGSVVAMLAVGQGASVQAMEQIERLGSKNIILTSIKPSEEKQVATAAKRTYLSVYGLLYEDEPRIAQSCHAVVRTVPAKIIRQNVQLGPRTGRVRLVGTTPDWFDLVQRPLVAGRVLSWRDMEDRAGVCVLAEQPARNVLANQHTIGQIIRIGDNTFRVIGILQTEAGGGGVQTPDLPIDAYVPLNVVRERYGDMVTQRSSGSFIREQVELHKLIVQVDTLDAVEPTAVAIRTMLEHFHPKLDYMMTVPQALLRQARQTQRIFNIVLSSIAGISLLVGGIGIMNIMLASVTERTREIGIRRAIGAKRRQIIGQFLIETIVLSTVGGLIGVGMGLFISVVIEHVAEMPTVVMAWSILLSLGISAMIGIVFGLYPAYRAAMLDPIVALRHE